MSFASESGSAGSGEVVVAPVDSVTVEVDVVDVAGAVVDGDVVEVVEVIEAVEVVDVAVEVVELVVEAGVVVVSSSSPHPAARTRATPAAASAVLRLKRLRRWSPPGAGHSGGSR